MEKVKKGVFIKKAYIYSVHNDQNQYQKDLDLIKKYYKEENTYWLGLLLERYFHLIFGVCMRYFKDEREAKDHTQQICLEVVQHFQKKVQEIIFFKSWLYQVTKNHCLMVLRKKRFKTVSIEFSQMKGEKVLPEKGAFREKEQQFRLLEEAVSSLNTDQQTCIQQFYFKEKTYKEIAAENSLSLKQVKSFIQNGRRNIKVYMESKNNEKF